MLDNNEDFSGPKTNINALLQSMVEGMILQDRTGRIIQYNQAALDILGMGKEQLNEPESNELSSGPADMGEWDKIFPGKDHIGMNSLKTGEIQRNVMMRIFRYDGEVRWISLNAVPIINNRTGIPSQLICTFTDITEMRRMINDLKQVQLLFNISQELLVITNQEGYFKKINPRFTEVLGYNLSEIISQKFLDLVHSDDLETIKKEMEKLSDQKTPIHFINRCKTKYNKYRVFDWVVVPDMETNLIYFTARDITDYKSEELDLIHSSKVYSIGEMTSGLSYLINGQLSIIGGHIAFLKAHLEQERVDPIEMKKKIQSIEEAVKRLSKTTRDLSSFARSPENEEVADVPMERIVENVMSLCKEMFRIHSVELDVNIEEGLVIRCRETQIAHVLITLLNSAYNFAHVQRESWVELRAFPKNGMVVITITDSGENKDRTVSGISKGIIEENFGSIHYDLSSPNAKLVIEFPQVQMVR